MGIEKKSFASMVDELITTDVKCYFSQEIVMHSNDDKEIAKASKDAQQLNKRRNELIGALDEYVNDSNSPTRKTY
jgi:hypothetical protein